MLFWREVLLKHMSYYQNILIQVVWLGCPQSDQVRYDVQVLSTLLFEFATLLHLCTLYNSEFFQLVIVNSVFL